MRGKFISFEGPDGSGKTSVIKVVEKHFLDLGHEVMTFIAWIVISGIGAQQSLRIQECCRCLFRPVWSFEDISMRYTVLFMTINDYSGNIILKFSNFFPRF